MNHNEPGRDKVSEPSHLPKLEPTGERFMPEIPGNIYLEHMHRYLLTAPLVKGARVLDIASGEGFGSNILAQSAAEVIGVDISEAAILNARAKYARNGLRFEVGSVTAIPLPDHSVDFVISFEIEGRASNYMAGIDSRSKSISSDMQIAVRKADHEIQLMRLPGDNFMDTLRNKLNWGFDKRN